ncbi:MAG TPA: fused MFS/spermidine synthase, partial [Bryobacteraceae bacterium]
PVAIEPLMSQQQQFRWWSGGYLVFVLLATVAAFRTRAGDVDQNTGERPTAGQSLTWIALAACASTLWLAVANHLSQEVAAIPFLWILPLSLYLLSFILCFESSGWYRPTLFAWLLPAAWAAVCFRIAFQGSAGGLLWEIPVLAASLFVCCMFCHGELAESKPAPHEGLTYFYLMVALGGALGAVFVGVVAPNVFSTYLELPIGITGCVMLALMLLYGMASPKRLLRLAVMAALAFVVATRFNAPGQNVTRTRNFYGAILIADTGSGESAVRLLYNGKTLHGVQYLSPSRSRQPTAYFSVESGAGRVLGPHGASGRRVGIIGLGAGTLAAYGKPGDSFRFFEINPAVIEIASRQFRFLRESEAKTDVVMVDGRLGIGREPPESFDVIILDAFSDDSIPVHLLTREAFQVYSHHLRPGGVLAVHITNRYLDLYPVVEGLAVSLHKKIVAIHNSPDPGRQVYAADWAVLWDDTIHDFQAYSNSAAAPRKARLWTDDYSNLFGVLR